MQRKIVKNANTHGVIKTEIRTEFEVFIQPPNWAIKSVVQNHKGGILSLKRYILRNKAKLLVKLSTLHACRQGT